MDFILSILGIASLAFGSFVIVCSYLRQAKNFKNRDNPEAPHSSPAPFVGPLFVIAGLATMSVELSPWIILLFLFDPDTLIVVVGLVWLLYKGQKQS